MLRFQYKKFLLLSLLLHSFLLSMLCCFVDFSNELKIGSLKRENVAAYLSFAQQNVVKVTLSEQQSKQEKNLTVTHKEALPLLKQPITKKPVKKEKPIKYLTQKKASEARLSAKLSGEKVDEFLLMLHDAIAQKQVYPLAAEEMGRKGRVSIAFTLTLEGKLVYLHIAKSSGTSSLDEAALAAVREAAPFLQAKRFLTKPTPFQIDVVFD